MKTRVHIGWLGLLAGILSTAQAQPADEYRVKAAFLYNFTKFIEWPAETFKTPQDPFTICVLGQAAPGRALEETIAGKIVQGRPFAVRQLSDLVSATSCHILFVNSSERKRFRNGAGALRQAAVLTVGETPGFIADGGVVNFKLEGGRIVLEINPGAAECARLRISSKLLSIAQIVRVP